MNDGAVSPPAREFPLRRVAPFGFWDAVEGRAAFAFFAMRFPLFPDAFNLVFEPFPGCTFASERDDAAVPGFFRVFWDIRLPFVAFGRSLAVLPSASARAPESVWRLGKSDLCGVW